MSQKRGHRRGPNDSGIEQLLLYLKCHCRTVSTGNEGFYFSPVTVKAIEGETKAVTQKLLFPDCSMGTVKIAWDGEMSFFPGVFL